MLNIGEISKPSVDKDSLKVTKKLSEVDPVLAIQTVASEQKDNSEFTHNKNQLITDSEKSSKQTSSSKQAIIEESLYDESGKPIPAHQVDIKI